MFNQVSPDHSEKDTAQIHPYSKGVKSQEIRSKGKVRGNGTFAHDKNTDKMADTQLIDAQGEHCLLQESPFRIFTVSIL